MKTSSRLLTRVNAQIFYRLRTQPEFFSLILFFYHRCVSVFGIILFIGFQGDVNRSSLSLSFTFTNGISQVSFCHCRVKTRISAIFAIAFSISVAQMRKIILGCSVYAASSHHFDDHIISHMATLARF